LAEYTQTLATMNVAPAHVIAAVNDLMFASRIRAAAQQLDTAVAFVRSRAELLERGREARLVLLDLEARWLDATPDITALKAGADAPEVVAFASHVLGDVLLQARAAGADRVLARSAFVQQLPALLAPRKAEGRG
jgi:CheY-like chemotaxis protein